MISKKLKNVGKPRLFTDLKRALTTFYTHHTQNVKNHLEQLLAKEGGVNAEDFNGLTHLLCYLLTAENGYRPQVSVNLDVADYYHFQPATATSYQTQLGTLSENVALKTNHQPYISACSSTMRLLDLYYRYRLKFLKVFINIYTRVFIPPFPR